MDVDGAVDPSSAFVVVVIVEDDGGDHVHGAVIDHVEVDVEGNVCVNERRARAPTRAT